MSSRDPEDSVDELRAIGVLVEAEGGLRPIIVRHTNSIRVSWPRSPAHDAPRAHRILLTDELCELRRQARSRRGTGSPRPTISFSESVRVLAKELQERGIVIRRIAEDHGFHIMGTADGTPLQLWFLESDLEEVVHRHRSRRGVVAPSALHPSDGSAAPASGTTAEKLASGSST